MTNLGLVGLDVEQKLSPFRTLLPDLCELLGRARDLGLPSGRDDTLSRVRERREEVRHRLTGRADVSSTREELLGRVAPAEKDLVAGVEDDDLVKNVTKVEQAVSYASKTRGTWSSLGTLGRLVDRDSRGGAGVLRTKTQALDELKGVRGIETLL